MSRSGGDVAPAGRSPAELLRNYTLEFQRLGLATLHEKSAGEPGWFGPTFTQHAEEAHCREWDGGRASEEPPGGTGPVVRDRAAAA